MSRRYLLVIASGLLLFLTACPSSSDNGDGGANAALDGIRDRGSLRCGVNDQVPGFGFVEGENFSGFDIDFCRAVAAAVLGDADAVEFRPLTAEQRFTALQGDEIDVLIRNTTWTATRDGGEGGQFATTTFYDGQGMMVRADSAFNSLEDMSDTTVCVLKGTTTETNLETQFAQRGISYEPLSLDKNETIQDAFTNGRCDGWTSDRSQLAGIRSNWAAEAGGPEALRVLDDVMSKEPLGPVVREGENDLYDAVNWTVLVTILAEEFGITSANVDEMKSSDNPDIKRLLGEEKTDAGDAFDAGLGLDSDFAYNVIKAVGNYAEIYNRNVGPSTKLGLERGLNKLYSDGGLLYAPPYK